MCGYDYCSRILIYPAGQNLPLLITIDFSLIPNSTFSKTTGLISTNVFTDISQFVKQHLTLRYVIVFFFHRTSQKPKMPEVSINIYFSQVKISSEFTGLLSSFKASLSTCIKKIVAKVRHFNHSNGILIGRTSEELPLA